MENSMAVFDEIRKIASSVVCNKEQSKNLVHRVKKIIQSSELPNNLRPVLFDLLKRLRAFLVQFQTSSYVVSHWVVCDDSVQFRAFHYELNSILPDSNGVPETQLEEDARADFLDVRNVVLNSSKPQSPLEYGENRPLNHEMQTNLKILRTNHGDCTQINELKKFNTDFLSVGECVSAHAVKIYRARLRGLNIAIKKFKSTPNDPIETEKHHEAIRREALILQTHCFPGVIRFFGVDDPTSPSMIAMEAAIGSLSDFLNKDDKLILSNKISILAEVARTLAYLHTLGLTHRDINPKNILIVDGMKTKLTGFGLSKMQVIRGAAQYAEPGSALWYMAPELLVSDENEAEPAVEHSQATDVYAFAVTMNEVLSEKEPSLGEYSVVQVLDITNDGDARPQLFASENAVKSRANLKLQEMICRCWELKPFQRLNFASLDSKLSTFDTTKASVDTTDEHFCSSVVEIFTSSIFIAGHYSGDLVNHKRHGKGLIDTAEGIHYQGEWVNDELHGKGKMTWPSGESYEGDWEENKIHGRGVFYWANGDKYEGEFLYGLMEGKGVKACVDGRVYEGEWFKGTLEGVGTLFYQCSEYRGEFLAGEITGKGTLKYADGTEIVGEWLAPQLCRGTMQLPHGDTYTGLIFDGKQLMEAFMSFVELHANDILEGEQLIVYGGIFDENESVSVYSGYFTVNHPEGQGMMEFVDGREYIGEWVNGLFEGKGVLKYVDGSEYAGYFHAGVWNGQGTLRFPSINALITGEWVDGMIQGVGSITLNEDCYKGEWKNGTLESIDMKFQYKNGKLKITKKISLKDCGCIVS